jgi:hypothetical protein
MSLNDEIKNNKSKVFRRAYVKRRLLSTGLFESEWQEITKDVRKWGTVTQKIDQEKQGRIRFSSLSMQMANDDGVYNPSENENSLWFGYASQQRSLIKVEAGFEHSTLGADGIWVNSEFPSSNAEVYTGVLQGDINVNTRNIMNFNVKPLTQVFRDFPAKELTGFTSTGVTASEFMGMIRDQTDGAGEFIFRPFFGDTTTGFNIQTTTVAYASLDSAGSSDIIDKNVWQVVERLAESEDYLAYVDAGGVFNFIARDNISTSTTYTFNGVGSFDRTYGIQIKDISFFGFRHSKYYSRVTLKHGSADTTTSYETIEAEFAVAGDNSAWNFGHKTFAMQNTWLSATSAETIAQNVFDNVSSKKNEIEFNSSFVPNITITDRLSLNYDSNPTDPESLWDQNNWAATVAATATTIEQTTTSGAVGLNSITYVAQTFLAPSNVMTLQQVKILLYQAVTATGSVRMELWDTSLNSIAVPKSQLAISDSIDVSTLAFSASSETFTFSDYDLASSTSYAIVMSGISVTAGVIATRKAQTTPSLYVDGRQFGSTDTVPSSWSSNAANDLYFQVLGTVPTAVEGENELIWDDNAGSSISLLNDEYKPLSVKINLDKLETKIVAREI